MGHQQHKSKYKHSRKPALKTTLSILLILEVVGLSGYLLNQQYRVPFTSNASNETSIDEPLKTSAPSTPPQTAIVTNPIHDYVIPPITNGIAPVLSRIPTSENVVFLGIDDGANKQPFELQMMKDNNIKASLFLSYRFIKDNPTFFNDFIPEGSLIEDHTLDHKLLSQLSYQDQKQEICGEADLFQQLYGRRPVLFRPPGGDYNLNTQRAAADCGMKAVIMWIAKANGGSMQYQVGHQLRPGDIVLMHFRPEFKQDMQSFIDAEAKAGLHTELLEDWLQT